MTENPDGDAGTFRLSEPSWMPDPSLFLFVNVTVNVEGNVVVPPGATTAGLLGVQAGRLPGSTTWPCPQITIEYGLLEAALAGATKIKVAAAAAKNANPVARIR